MGRGRGQELRGSAAEWKDKAVLAARPGGSAWVNMEMVVNEMLAHWCVAVMLLISPQEKVVWI